MDDVVAELAQLRACGVQIQDLPELGTSTASPTSGSLSRPGSPTPTTTRSAQLHHPWRLGDAVRDATSAIYHAQRGGTWIPGQQRRIRQLAPGTWNQALAGVLGASPGWQDDGHGHHVVEVAICPDVVWLAARSLRARSASHHTAV